MGDRIMDESDRVLEQVVTAFEGLKRNKRNFRQDR